MKRTGWMMTLALISNAGAHAGDAEPVAPVVGEAAPKLRLGTTFKGTKGDLRPGTVYVIEFWATWCKPCLQQLPHVRELQRTYPKVEFIWLDVWEGDENGVGRFVERMGDQMPFTVAIDADRDADGIGATAKSWLPATRLKGIPATVIIDAEGRVAWMGPPEKVDGPLKSVVEGSWDIAAASRVSRLRRDLTRTLEAYDNRLRLALDEGPEATSAVLDEYIAALEASRRDIPGAAPRKP